MTIPASLWQQQNDRRVVTQLMHGFMPLLVGCIMLLASFFPWLNDPLGVTYIGWNIPVDVGWQIRLLWLNYGLLCSACALLAFSQVYRYWRPGRRPTEPIDSLLLLGLTCLIPTALFYLQYICVDIHAADTLAQHKIQALLIQQHFTYKFSDDLIQLQPLQISSASLQGRIQILIDQVAIGQLLPLLCSWLCISCHSIAKSPAWQFSRSKQWKRWLLGAVIACCILGRGPAAMLCDTQAKNLLVEGDYPGAIHWLDAAAFLNPWFQQVAFYHVQRGWAWYFLRPDQTDPDRLGYLSSVYLQQGNLAGAYQNDLIIQNKQKYPPAWVTAQQSLVLANLAETLQQRNGPAIQRLQFDETALPWLQDLINTDSTNVYSRYATGLIEYNQHDYSNCILQMTEVIQLSTNSDIQSAAYSYIGLSTEALGNPVAGRNFLLKAEMLDPLYHNAMAREELSGLH